MILALVAEIDPTNYPQGVPPYVYGLHVYLGAHVFSISPSYGLVLRGRITHISETHMNVDRCTPLYGKRTLYIDDVL